MNRIFPAFTILAAAAAALATASCKGDGTEPASPVISFTIQPAAMTTFYEENIPADAKLTVGATATEGAAISYQWYGNATDSNSGGTAIGGATGASYNLPVTLTAGTYYYFCEARAEGAASVRSGVATVVVNEKEISVIITITVNPDAETIINEGDIPADAKLTFGVTATEGAAISYQWYSNTSYGNSGGTPINGATDASYNIPVTLTKGTYYYFCEARAEGAVSVRSGVATIIVKDKVVPVITITKQPNSVYLTYGYITGEKKLSAQATVTMGAELSYQWYNRDGQSGGDTAIEGATDASFAPPSDLMPGKYPYVCEISATGGAVPVKTGIGYAEVSVSVFTITTQPISSSFIVGQIPVNTWIYVGVMGSGNARPNYQWYSNTTASNVGGTPIVGATSLRYTIPTTLSVGAYNYFCEVYADYVETVRSDVATITVRN